MFFSLDKFNLDLAIPSTDSAIHRLYKAIHQILLLRLNHTEIACLKTLTLFRPGMFHVMLCLFSWRVIAKIYNGRGILYILTFSSLA